MTIIQIKKSAKIDAKIEEIYRIIYQLRYEAQSEALDLLKRFQGESYEDFVQIGIKLSECAQTTQKPIYQSKYRGSPIYFCDEEKDILIQLNAILEHCLMLQNAINPFNTKKIEKQIKKLKSQIESLQDSKKVAQQIKKCKDQISALQQKIRVGKLTPFQ